MGREHLDLLITGATAFLPEPLANAAVGVRDGRIVYVGAERPAMTTAAEIVADGLFLLPGLIDAHVHFRVPGIDHKEDYEHGSRAALVGGVTTILDMPNTKPALTTKELLAAKHAQIKGRSLVDYGFHFMLTRDNVSEIERIEKGEVSSVKVFMAGHETAPDVVYDIEYLKRVAAVLAAKGIVMTVHAEYQPLLSKSKMNRAQEYAQDRKREAAIEAVRYLVEIARETGCTIHVVHTSTVEEAEMILQAKAEGVPIRFEVIHPHLSFTEQDLVEGGWNYKLSPPLRKHHDVETLWGHVIDLAVDMIGSDHAPHTKAEKSGEIPPAGMPGVQETLSVLYTGLSARLGDPIRVCSIITELAAARPARLFELTGKGRITVGGDADLVLFDPSGEWQVTPDALYAKCGWSPYQGRVLQGTVLSTWLRGMNVYAEGRFADAYLGEPVRLGAERDHKERELQR